MKVEKSKKQLTITLEYTDTSEAIRQLHDIQLAILKKRKKYDRLFTNAVVVEWEIKTIVPFDYREEEINGVWCQVFQSKMNNEV
jgi:hypothetical protein